MIASGSTSLPAPPARVREVLADPAAFAAALPNVEELEREPGGDSFSATIRPAIALGEVPVRTTWRPRPAAGEAIVYSMEGRTGEQYVSLEAELELSSGEGGSTVAGWKVSFEVTGTMRAAGQRTIAAIVGAQAEQVLQAAGRLAAEG